MNILGDIVSGKNTPQVKKQLVQPTQNKIVFFPNNDTVKFKIRTGIINTILNFNDPTKHTRFVSLVQSLPKLWINKLIRQIIINVKGNKNLITFLYDHKINMHTVDELPTHIIRQLLKSLSFFNAYVNINKDVGNLGDNLAIAYGNWSQQHWSPVGDSRIILSKTSKPVLNDDPLVWGSPSYGQGKNDDTSQTYSSYLNIPCNNQTNISFDMNLAYSRPGVVTTISLVPMGMNWKEDDISSYITYTSPAKTFETITSGWFAGKSETEKLALIKKLAPEFGFGFNDSHKQGQGGSQQITLVDASPTGLQVSLHGVLTDSEHYIKKKESNGSTVYIPNRDDKQLLGSINNNTDLYYNELDYENGGAYCNIHGHGGGVDGNGSYKLERYNGTTYDNITNNYTTTTKAQLQTYGPGSQFLINTLNPFNVTCDIKYSETNYTITLKVIISQNNDKGGIENLRITVESNGFNKNLGLDKMNLVTSYWSTGKPDTATIITQDPLNYQKYTTWWLDGVNSDDPPTPTTEQPIRGITSVPQIRLYQNYMTQTNSVINELTQNMSTNFLDYNKYALPVYYYANHSTEQINSKSAVSSYPPIICLISNLNITNSSISQTPTELYGWVMDIIYTGLSDQPDNNEIVKTYWGGKHNGSFQMSYTTKPTFLPTNSNGFRKNFIHKGDVSSTTSDKCATNCSEYAMAHCTYALEPTIPAEYKNEESTNQYDFAGDILGMNSIRKKECMNTNTDPTKGVVGIKLDTDEYELQAEYGLNLFEAPGIIINNYQFGSPQV